LTVILVAVLVGLWGLVLLPVLIKDRADTSPVGSAGVFGRSMNALGSSQPPIGGRWVLMPISPEDEPLLRLDVERRRKIFFSLLATFGAIVAIFLMTQSRIFLWAGAVIGLCLAAFVAYLIQSKKKWDQFHLIGDSPKQVTARSRMDNAGNVVSISPSSQIRVKYPPKPNPQRQMQDLAKDEEFWQIPSFSEDESRIPS
jgi:hypothetical protein